MKIKGKTKGFTLAELLVYVGLMTFLVIVIINTIVSVTRLEARHSTAEGVTRSALIALNRIDREILAADDAVVTGGTLTLSGTDQDGNPRTVDFMLRGSSIAWRENGEDMGALTETAIAATDLGWSIESASTTKAVRGSFKLNGIPYQFTSVIRRTQ